MSKFVGDKPSNTSIYILGEQSAFIRKRFAFDVKYKNLRSITAATFLRGTIVFVS